SVLSHSGSRPSSSRTTLARLSGSAMRSALISRIVILSTSSPTETGTMMVFMRLLLAAGAPSLPEGRNGPCAAAPKNLRTPHPGANTASTVAGADCRRPGYPRGGDMASEHGGRGISLATGIALGIAIGAAIGVAMDNVALGIGPGIAIGIALSLATSSKRTKRGDDAGTGGNRNDGGS